MSLHQIDREKRDLPGRLEPDCSKADPRALTRLTGLLSQYVDLRCARSGHLLVAKPGHYVQVCAIRDCSGQLIYFSAAERPYATPKTEEDREFILVIEEVLLDSAERDQLRLGAGRGSSPLRTSLEKAVGTPLGNAPFYRVALSTVKGAKTSMILFEDPSATESLRAFLEIGPGEVSPFAMGVLPLAPLEEAARKKPLTGG